MKEWQRIVFRIPGPVQSNERHRMTKKGHTYTPEKTTMYRNWIRQCFLKAQKEHGWKYEDGPVRMQIEVFYEIPKSYPAWKVDSIRKRRYLPKKKPDCDNIGKGILDALNGLAYKDDSQVFSLEVLKRFCEPGNEPCVQVRMQNNPQPETAKEAKEY